MTSTAAEPATGSSSADGAGSPEPLDPDDYGRTGEPGERAVEGRPYVQPVRVLVLIGLVAALGFGSGLPTLFTVLAVLIMIFLHELGHFVMARRAGMKVTEFMIGFGPRIASFRRGEVEFGLKAIPAGAYVKIIGMANIEQVPPQDEASTYRQKSYWQRFGVAVAGSTMHFVLALVLAFSAFAFVGVQGTGQWSVRAVSEGSAADVAGIQPRDRVVKIGDDSVRTFSEMSEAARQRPGKRVPVVVERDGGSITSTVVIAARMAIGGTRDEDLDLYQGPDGKIRASVTFDGAVAAAGIRDADVVVGVNGAPVGSLDDVAARVGRSDGGTVLLAVRRGETEVPIRVDLGTAVKAGKVSGFLGVGEAAEPVGLGAAAVESGRFFGRFATGTVVGIGRFFNPANLVRFANRVLTTAPGEARDDDQPQTMRERRDAFSAREGNRVSSIVGAVMLGSEQQDWGDFLIFLAALNIGIGLINLVPLPPFDGGHVAIATYERIRELRRRDGKRYFADANKLLPVAYGVVMVMLVVGVMAIYLDVADPARL